VASKPLDLPEDAVSEGPATANETTAPDQRGSGLRSPLGDGPKISDSGAYLSAAYEVTVDVGGKPFKVIREDR
jgi:hypothetical protein